MRGETVAWQPLLNEFGQEILIKKIRQHGVAPLLARRLRNQAGDSELAGLFGSIKELAHGCVSIENYLRDEWLGLLGDFSSRGIKPLLLKGMALAYSVYESPYLRPRGDIDFLVSDDNIAEAKALLLHRNYEKVLNRDGELAGHYQDMYCKCVSGDYLVKFEIHWRLTSNLAFYEKFSYRELETDSQPLSSLSSDSYGLSRVYALLHAAIHYHSDPSHIRRLIWVWDVHLLVQSLSGEELDRALLLARQKQCLTLTLELLEISRQCFATPYSDDRVTAYRQTLSKLPREPAEKMLVQSGPVSFFMSQFKLLPSWKLRFQYLNELMFPSPEYMRERFSDATFKLLPYLYAKRIALGFAKLVRTTR